MNVCGIRRLAGGAVALGLLASPAHADVPGICPRKADGREVDPNALVSMDALAGAALDAAKVGVTLFARASAVAPIPRLTSLQSVLVRGESLCSDTPGADTITCTKSERQALGQAQFKLLDIIRDPALTGIPHGSGVAPIPTVGELFASRAAIRCVAPLPVAGGAIVRSARGDTPQDPDARDRWSLTNVRVRGTPADIIYPRGSSAYSDADKAKLTIGGDSGKTFTRLVGTVGYAVPLRGHHDIEAGTFTTFEAVPFLAANIDTSRKKPDARKVTSNAIAVGVSFAYDATTAYSRKERGSDGRLETRFAAFDSYFAASPRYSVNYEDDSALAGLNLLWRPAFSLGSITHGIPINIQRKIGALPLGWTVITDLRSNNGTYVRTGSRLSADSHDFMRVGGRLGLGVTSIAKSPVPFELVLADSWMWAVTGKPGHLSRLDTILTLYLNEDKIFGVELGYKRGRVEDQDERDKSWSLGFVAKY